MKATQNKNISVLGYGFNQEILLRDREGKLKSVVYSRKQSSMCTTTYMISVKLEKFFVPFTLFYFQVTMKLSYVRKKDDMTE